ncbi:cob(I)yrinic acid a,c-diamide adenosyltransferase [Myxococcota bacterium]|nr:cob(I)yrinic acid a,c-diamide adenosyltransferase [Myxococcota bacterium]
MKLYTRGGDAGSTGLLGGRRRKDDLRVACYGTVDELNVVIAEARLACAAWPDLDDELIRIQNQLFTLGAFLATEPTHMGRQPARLGQAEIDGLEALIDTYDAQTPPLTAFVLPGGSPANVALHRARVTCRRAERLAVTLSNEADLGATLPYLNRLSDALFALSRWVIHQAGGEEILWRGGAR